MAAEQVDNWQGLSQSIEAVLLRPNTVPPAHDLAHARRFLEEALELECRAYGELPSEVVDTALTRINQLSTRLAEAHPQRSPASPSAPRAKLQWPVAPVSVTSLFGLRLHPMTRVYQLHQGIDLAAAKGQRVTAAGDGTVTQASYVEGYGNLVEVEHGQGVRTRYGHLSMILVGAGETLKQGEVLGLAGATGLVTGAHLHFEIWRNGQSVDPFEALGDPDAAPVAKR